MSFIKKIFKRGNEEAKEESEEDKIKKALKENKNIVLGELPRYYKKSSNLIFVGSLKGGVGKSFIATNLAIILSALSPSGRDIFAVDLDLDNQTTSTVLPPEGQMEMLMRTVINSGARELSVADVFIEGIVPKGWIIPKFSHNTYGCNGAQIPYSFKLIPSYDKTRDKEQQVILKSLDTKTLRVGVDALINYFQIKKNTNKDFIAIFDGKQKSDLGINVEPIYKQLVEKSDLFLLVTEPPYLSFNDITAPYRGVLDKTIIIVNKAEPAEIDKISLLIQDGVNYNVPVFAIPTSDNDSDVYKRMYKAPSADKLNRTIPLHIMALAYFLNLINDDNLKISGCETTVYAILSNYKKLFAGAKV